MNGKCLHNNSQSFFVFHFYYFVFFCFFVPVLLTQEKDRWEQTCYSLALKVAEKRQLKTIQQIQLSGKAWEKLGTHFTILIVDKDTKEVGGATDQVTPSKNQCLVSL